MNNPRHSIFTPIFLWLLIIAVLSYGVSLGASFFTENTQIQILSALIFITISFLIVLKIKLQKPMSFVINEMKALLTGKSYRRILTKRVDEIGVLSHFFNEVTRNLENISSDVKQHVALKKEVNLAQNIQRDLLPKTLPKINGLEISAKTRPASEIGGDAYNFYEKNGRHFAYIGDSTGHGIPAGLIMIMVDVLMDTFITLQDDLLEILVEINRFLKPNLRPSMFMTLLLLEWMPAKNSFEFVGAGHEYLIHIRPNTSTVTAIPSGGIALGMLPDNRALTKKQEIQMEKGDFLVLYTDGINEAKNKTGEIYGLEKLKEFLKNQATEATSADEIFEKLAIDVSRFMDGHIQEDDMTLLVFKYVGSESVVDVEAPLNAVSA